jgi:PhnB protein
VALRHKETMMTQLDVYLFFDGQCAEAMRFYERVLGGTLQMMTHAESPMKDQMPAGSGDRIMHSSLTLSSGRTLMASDAMAGQGAAMKGFSLSLGYDRTDEGRRVFDALAEGGQVTMPMQKTFWAEAFGMLVDRFGTPWMISCEHASG